MGTKRKSLFIILSIFAILLLGACKKKNVDGPTTTKSLIYKMAGKHKLVGTYSYSCWYCRPPEDTTYPKALITDITVLNDSTISFTRTGGTITCILFEHDSAHNRFLFDAGSSGYQSEGMSYYYVRDSIIYHASSKTHGDGWWEKLHTE